MNKTKGNIKTVNKFHEYLYQFISSSYSPLDYTQESDIFDIVKRTARRMNQELEYKNTAILFHCVWSSVKNDFTNIGVTGKKPTKWILLVATAQYLNLTKEQTTSGLEYFNLN